MAPLSTPFDPDQDLILVPVKLEGPRGGRNYLFALDTACTHTLVKHEALADIGYQARDGDRLATVTSALGVEVGFLLRVARLEALGYGFAEFSVNAQDLPDDSGIDGLLGLNFLRRFNYEIRSREGRILVAPA